MKVAHIVSFLNNKIPLIDWKINMNSTHIVLFRNKKITQTKEWN